jgi:hypothetical protein
MQWSGPSTTLFTSSFRFFFVFRLCHFLMLVTAVTIHLRSLLLVFGTSFLFSILLHSLLSLLLPLFEIDCCHGVNRFHHPNVILCFTITGKKKVVVGLLYLFPFQGRISCTWIVHAVPGVGLTCIDHPVSPFTPTLLSFTPVSIEVVLDFVHPGRYIFRCWLIVGALNDHIAFPIKYFVFVPYYLGFVSRFYLTLMLIHDHTAYNQVQAHVDRLNGLLLKRFGG